MNARKGAAHYRSELSNIAKRKLRRERKERRRRDKRKIKMETTKATELPTASVYGEATGVSKGETQ